MKSSQIALACIVMLPLFALHQCAYGCEYGCSRGGEIKLWNQCTDVLSWPMPCSGT
ncbi:unnamed protein product [Eruca vesicaria subsp. sativa]|uniref:Uncharacterized protein n=1 Tax=Eruca vesicaria subsp. sativa TaxID=29727 RepID=A0ABC8KAK6_ERUVS|nr:unnamed protein product [Eruca vesicaria subsp. sativa]